MRYKSNALPKVMRYKSNALPKVMRYKSNALPKVMRYKSNALPKVMRYKSNALPKVMRYKSNALPKVSVFGVIENGLIDPRPHYRFRCVFNCPHALKRSKTLNDMLCHRLNNSLRNKIVPPCGSCSSTMMGRSIKSQCPYNRCSIKKRKNR